MADTIEQLQARLLALNIAIDSGALTVRHGENFVTYRNLAEMMAIAQKLTLVIAGATGETRHRVLHIRNESGW